MNLIMYINSSRTRVKTVKWAGRLEGDEQPPGDLRPGHAAPRLHPGPHGPRTARGGGLLLHLGMNFKI